MPISIYYNSVTDCDENIYGDSGTVSSPNYPGYYPNNADCKYWVTLETSGHIHMIFSHFDVEYGGPSCPFDVLQVRHYWIIFTIYESSSKLINYIYFCNCDTLQVGLFFKCTHKILARDIKRVIRMTMSMCM